MAACGTYSRQTMSREFGEGGALPSDALGASARSRRSLTASGPLESTGERDDAQGTELAERAPTHSTPPGVMTHTLHPKYGRGSHAIDLTEFEAERSASARLATKLTDLFASPGYSPPHLPGVAMQILELSRRTEVTVGEIVTLLESDPMVAGRVLRIVQSPVYAGRSQITSLRQAVIRLGLNTMRDVVLEDAMNMKMFRSQVYGDWMESVRRHSVLTGHCARAVARAADAPGEYAFMCGLLHDIGMAATLIVLTEEKDPPPPATIAAALGTTHERASGVLAGLWRMPPQVASVIGNHHHFEAAGEDAVPAAVVCVAEEIATRIGCPALSNQDVDRTDAESLLAARKLLALDAASWGRLLEQAEETREHLGL